MRLIYLLSIFVIRDIIFFLGYVPCFPIENIRILPGHIVKVLYKTN